MINKEININCINVDEEFKNEYRKYFNKCNINFIDNIFENYKDKIDIDKQNKLFKEYVVFKFLYDNEGLFIDGNFEFLKSIDNFFGNDFFIGYRDNNNIACNIIWVKEKNNSFIYKTLELIKTQKYEDITDVFSVILKKDLSNNYNYLQRFEDNIYLYPYDYFYPIDYEYVGKSFTDNLKAIFYDKEKQIGKKAKLKIKLARKYGVESFNYFFSTLRMVRNNLGYKKYLMMQNLKKKFSIKKDVGIEKAVNVLNKYINNNSSCNSSDKIDYIIIHNPRWLGVTSATKELFDNLVPLEEVFLDKNINMIVDLILKTKVSQVIFSAFDYGWDKIAIGLKKKNPKIKIKSFWHGSHSQVIEEINWQTNEMIIDLHKKGIIDVMGTCKESLVNFYKSQGYKTAFLNNTVVLDESIKEKVENLKNESKDYLRIGLYSAGTDWRKNTYNQIMAASLFNNAVLQVIPSRYEIEKLAYDNNLKLIGSNSHLKREDLLIEMSKNDITLYVTFSECAPMLPIESLEVGTICLTGNNHHYFDDSELYQYLVVEREDDVISIYEKMKYALDNKEKIFKLYREWKVKNDLNTKNSVKEFLEM